MAHKIDHAVLHRTAKVFMDSGRAPSYEAAIYLLQKFGLTILVGKEIAFSIPHQAALLTIVNIARRTLLGGVEVVGVPDVPSLSPLAPDKSLPDAVKELKATLAQTVCNDRPLIVIGGPNITSTNRGCWRLTWEGWRGGVVPMSANKRLSEDGLNPLAPLLAAAAGAAEVFSFLAQDHAMAGLRTAGLSLWAPGRDWLTPDLSEPPITHLPSKLWFIGVGNLGQAFSWSLSTLPYQCPSEVQLLLQDFDRISKSNDSTSLLSFPADVGKRKTRVVAKWLEERGFECVIDERRFEKSTSRAETEPSVALCGVDNPLARAELGNAKFELIVEAGLGGGPESFRSIVMHTFPASRTPMAVWSRQVGQSEGSYEDQPAYLKLKKDGMERCGVAQLASRTVGVPFVGMMAACFVFSELLRRLNGGAALEVASISAVALDDIELVPISVVPYQFGHVVARSA